MRALLLALLLATSPAWAETNVCNVISSLPAVVSSPGVYCLEKDLSLPVGTGSEVGISIHLASDVTLDCNGHAITGTTLSPDDPALGDTHYGYAGIHVGASSRVTVRNCRVHGFFRGLVAERGGSGTPRSRDVLFEDNRVDGSLLGIYFISEGLGVVRRNVVTDAKHTAFSSFAPPVSGSRTTIHDNVFSRAGNMVRRHVDPFGVYGDPVSLELGGGDAWMIFENNLVAESVGPAGEQTPVFAIRYAWTGQGMIVRNNRILAPADPAQAGARTLVFQDNLGPTCRENVIVGYGASLPAACTDSTNVAY